MVPFGYFVWELTEVTLFFEKRFQITGIHEYISHLKCNFRSTYMKKPLNFPLWFFCLFVVAENFLKVALFLETSSVLKSS